MKYKEWRKKKAFLRYLTRISKNLEQTHLTADSVIQSIGYLSKSLVEKSLYCLLKCKK